MMSVLPFSETTKQLTLTYPTMENAMTKSGLKITVVSTFTSKTFGDCAKEVKLGKAKAVPIDRVFKEQLANAEMTANDKALVISWAKFTLAGKEFKRNKCFTPSIKAKVTKGINRLRSLIEALSGEPMVIVKTAKPKTNTKPKGSKVSAELAETLAGLTPELQSAFLAMMKAQK